MLKWSTGTSGWLNKSCINVLSACLCPNIWKRLNASCFSDHLTIEHILKLSSSTQCGHSIHVMLCTCLCTLHMFCHTHIVGLALFISDILCASSNEISKPLAPRHFSKVAGYCLISANICILIKGCKQWAICSGWTDNTTTTTTTNG